MKRNHFKELLKEGKPTLGTRVVSPWPRVVEAIGLTGLFDYVEYASEYSPWNLELLENLARTYELFPNMSPMIKIGELERAALVQRAVDAGFQNVKFADIRSAQDVREGIRLVRSEAAGGIHGWTHGRNTLAVGPQEWIEAMNDVGIVLVIEKKSAKDDLEEILSIKDVDMVTLGPADYLISIGKPGKPGQYFQHPEIEVVEREIIELTQKMGVPYRAHPNSFEGAKPYIDMGVRHFSLGMDLDYIYQQSKKEGEGVRKLLESVV
jgi:2-keto-3-deoxy-L-rhamnonate aldolase RhmA